MRAVASPERVRALALPALAELRAGAARVSITPPVRDFSYPLGGYVTPERLTKKARDRSEMS